MKIEQIATDKLIPYARNAKKHDAAQVSKIAGSIREFGFNNPVLIDKDNGIIAGHGRVMAAQSLSLDTVPCIRLGHLTDTQRRAYILADNRLAEIGGGWDEEMLKLELSELGDLDIDLEAIGFGAEDLAGLDIVDETEIESEKHEDETPEPPLSPVTKRGDIWNLGKHRIICGDCREFQDIEKLLGVNQINVAVTSPPYASQRKYDESSGFKPIPPNEYVEWYSDVASNIMAKLATDGSYFCNIKEHCDDGQRSLYVKDLTLAHVREWGWRFVDEFVWKRGGVPGKWANRFKNQWEPIFHFSKSNDIKLIHQNVMHESEGAFDYSPDNPKSKTGFFSNRGRSDIAKKGMALPGNVLEIGTEVGLTEVHSAPYPVALPEFFIKAFSDAGDIIFDPFMGSGTTMIAAEKNGRVACGTEISPQYCDVIVMRWQNLTGKKATHESSGKTFDEMKAAKP
jgi:DNA modification methylase